MLRSRPAFWIAFLTLTSGCAARPQPAPPVTIDVQPAPAARAPEPQAAEDTATGGAVLVWSSEGGGTTWHVAEDGAVLREEPGIVVATRRGEWRWEIRTEDVETSACELALGDVHGPGEGTGQRAHLVLRGAGARQEVITPPDADGSNVIEHRATVIGSVGPYLFIEERTYTYACGAHGFDGAGFVVWDAERGAAVDLLAEVPGVPALQREAAALLDAFEEIPVAARQAQDPPALVKLAPGYAARGWLRMTAQLARGACYACGDGAWSSYSRSAMVPIERLPARLAPWASPPPGVRAFLARTPGAPINGWSRP
ncbi:hypothetical protein SOCEGT47_006830 [Sorangium cellulosum]|uniref:Secreted protein n=1 Tax=Sorangium cellulosum TaxID=56 RepID=A0A4P2PUD7_SORCE|nr:hypothetical protein [Sorangium cellulosum]AUX20218.1 hypothetical protein SOCEGT47_006830 [Sorangium cellulosum]